MRVIVFFFIVKKPFFPTLPIFFYQVRYSGCGCMKQKHHLEFNFLYSHIFLCGMEFLEPVLPIAWNTRMVGLAPRQISSFADVAVTNELRPAAPPPPISSLVTHR